jgi:hypothetical protein
VGYLSRNKETIESNLFRKGFSIEGEDVMVDCVLCGCWFNGYGHNPEPLAKAFYRCCDDCYRLLVIPARIGMHYNKNKNGDEEE